MSKLHSFSVSPLLKPLWLVAMAGVVLGSSRAGMAQAVPGKKVAVISKESVTTADGWEIPIRYYQSTQGKEAAVVLLLQGEGENQLVWQKEKTGLAERLHADGFAVLTCDLRKQGEAKNARGNSAGKLDPNDYKAMASTSRLSELECIQEFLFKEHQLGRLNMAKMGIVAVGNVAPVAINWMANDWAKKPYTDAPTPAACTPRGQTTKALILLSPDEAVKGINSARALQFLGRLPVSILFLYGAGDRNAVQDVRKMHDQVSTGPGSDKKIFQESYKTMLSGAGLLNKQLNTEALVVGFLKKQVQELALNWSDRRSRLER